jgi:RNA polymerase sigma factor (sigma-70 family)
LTVKTQPDAESDAALVARFARLRDEEAFAELMSRHGPMVLGVSARMLRQRQDAEDVLQAVFLTLAARARALRRVRSVGGWLHNVAVRVSLNSLKMKRRRQAGLRRLQHDHIEPHADESHELTGLLDEELAQLPARFKEVVILQDLEGFSRSEVAKKLRLPPGTVASRLDRGRKLLRDRLMRRGVTVGASGLAAALAGCAEAFQALPIALLHETFRNAQSFLAGTTASGSAVAPTITSLAQGELNRMFLTKLSTTVGIIALAAALVLGALPTSQSLGLISKIQAGQFFLDDFEDGSATDGNPVRWVPEFPPFHLGTRDVVQGSFVVTPPPAPTPFPGAPPNAAEADSAVEGQLYEDLSIRTRFRVTGAGDYWVILSARSTYADATGIGSGVYAGFNATGGLFLGYTENLAATDISGIDTPLDGRATDIHMLFSIFGDQLNLWAWAEGDVKPANPQVVASIPAQLSQQGRVSLGVIQSVTGPGPIQVAFREFLVVPEPNSAVLGSFGAVVLATFAFRTRLRRLGRP